MFGLATILLHLITVIRIATLKYFSLQLTLFQCPYVVTVYEQPVAGWRCQETYLIRHANANAFMALLNFMAFKCLVKMTLQQIFHHRCHSLYLLLPNCGLPTLQTLLFSSKMFLVPLGFFFFFSFLGLWSFRSARFNLVVFLVN